MLRQATNLDKTDFFKAGKSRSDLPAQPATITSYESNIYRSWSNVSIVHSELLHGRQSTWVKRLTSSYYHESVA